MTYNTKSDIILTARCVTKDVRPCSLALIFAGESSSSRLGSNHPNAAPTTNTAPSTIRARKPPIAALVACDITIAILNITYHLNVIIWIRNLFSFFSTSKKFALFRLHLASLLMTILLKLTLYLLMYNIENSSENSCKT